MSISCLIRVQYSIRWQARKEDTSRPANTPKVMTMPRGGCPEVLNKAVDTVTVKMTNMKGIHLCVTSRMILRDRVSWSMWNISGRTVQEASMAG